MGNYLEDGLAFVLQERVLADAVLSRIYAAALHGEGGAPDNFTTSTCSSPGVINVDSISSSGSGASSKAMSPAKEAAPRRRRSWMK